MSENVSIPLNTAAATLAWCENFDNVVGASPATYDLSAGDAVAITAAVLAFRNAYDVAGVASRVAVNPSGYTQPNRAALFAARSSCLGVVRPFAVQIQANDGISDQDKLDAGIYPRNFTRTPRNCPQSNPVLSFLSATAGQHLLSFSDSASPSSKRKPFGAIGMALSIYVGELVAPDVNSLLWSGNYSRNMVQVLFSAPGQSGQIATYAARWFGVRGDMSPWSPMINAVIV